MHQFGVLRGDDDCGTRGHGVAHNNGGGLELAEQRFDVASGVFVTVAGERGVAVAVPAEVGGDHRVAGGDELGGEETVARAEVAHAGDEHNEGSLPLDVVGDVALLRTGEVLRGWCS